MTPQENPYNLRVFETTRYTQIEPPIHRGLTREDLRGIVGRLEDPWDGYKFDEALREVYILEIS